MNIRRFSQLNLAVLLTLLLVGCNTSKPHRPLMGGYATERRTSLNDGFESAENQSSGERESKETGLETGYDGGDMEASPGLPVINIPVESQILRREGYVASYNKDTKIANWVMWHLTSERLTGPAKRKNSGFEEDGDVPLPRAMDRDYSRSGYDRGHLCPAGDNKFSDKAMAQSFLFTNICPQDPNLNRGDWNEMEQQCRRWAEQYGDIYVVAGPILFRGKHKTIGRNKVTVPEAFFKVVLCLQGKPKGIGFIYRNEEGNRPKGDYVNSIREVERLTGFDFFSRLEDGLENKVERTADFGSW